MRCLTVSTLWLTLAITLTSGARSEEGGEWIPLAPLATARQETGAALIGNRLYVVGGLVSGIRALASVEVYDVNADAWSQAPPMPVALDHMAVAAVDGRLYVIGGFSGDFAARDELWIYDPATDSWSSGAPLPEARGAPWAVAFRGRIYLFGGANSADVAQRSTFIYDPATDEWVEGAPMPTPREHLNAAVVGDFIYVIGGRAGASTPVNERYDPVTDSWQTLAPMPTSRSAMALASVDGKIYAMGGETPRLFAVNEVYDPATDTWDCAAPMPVPRHGVAAVALNDRILVPAGGEVQGLRPSAVLDSFVPLPGVVEQESTLSFSRATFMAGEADSVAAVQVIRQGGSAGEVSVDYSSLDDTATAGEDYEAVSGTLSFADGETGSKSFDVSILDDAEVEADERIVLQLSDPVGAQLGSPAQAVLILRDDDANPGQLEFSSDHLVVDEDAGTATLAVSRSGGTSGSVSVTYTSTDLSAQAGFDYGASSGVLEWAPGEAQARSFTVPLLDDAAAEGTELVAFELTAPTGGATLGERSSAVLVVEDDDRPAGCAPSELALCLLDGRFRLEVTWRDPRSLAVGTGGALPESDQSGFFWFFDAANFELVLKVLDGRGVTGAFWVFYGALSDVEYWITVIDTETGALRLFHNPPFTLASVADTQAFPEAAAAAERREAVGRHRAGPPTPLLAETCVEAPEVLCLGGGRFRVEVAWEVPSGEAGAGVSIPKTDQTGVFWFFDETNVELALKILDGTGFNGRFWVFYGALSNVAYTITVTDTVTGAVKQYTNEQGNLASVADIEAFDGP